MRGKHRANWNYYLVDKDYKTVYKTDRYETISKFAINYVKENSLGYPYEFKIIDFTASGLGGTVTPISVKRGPISEISLEKWDNA